MKPLSKLNDNIRYSMNWMRGQMICYAELSEDSSEGSLLLRWLFNENLMKNCSLSLRKKEVNTIEYEVSKEGGSLGIVDRLSITKSCSSGKISIKSLKAPS